MADTTDKDTATQEPPSEDNASTFMAPPENEAGTPPATPETTAPDTQDPISNEELDEILNTTSDAETPEGVDPVALADGAQLQDGKPSVQPPAPTDFSTRPQPEEPKDEGGKPEELLGQDKTAGWQMKGWWEARFGFSPTEQLKDAIANSGDAWKMDRKGNFKIELSDGKKMFAGEKKIDGERKIVVETTGWGFKMDTARQIVETHKSLGSKSIEFTQGSRKAKRMVWAMATHNGIKVRNYKPGKKDYELLMQLRRDEVLKNEAGGGDKPDAPGVTEGSGAPAPGVVEGDGQKQDKVAGVSPADSKVANDTTAPKHETRVKRVSKVGRAIETGMEVASTKLESAKAHHNMLHKQLETTPKSQQGPVKEKLSERGRDIKNARQFMANLHDLAKNPDRVAQIERDPGKMRAMTEANREMRNGNTGQALVKQTMAGIGVTKSQKAEVKVSNMPDAKARPTAPPPKMSGPTAGSA